MGNMVRQMVQTNLDDTQYRNIIRVSNSLDPDQDRHSVGPDLGIQTVRKSYQQTTLAGKEEMTTNPVASFLSYYGPNLLTIFTVHRITMDGESFYSLPFTEIILIYYCLTQLFLFRELWIILAKGDVASKLDSYTI